MSKRQRHWGYQLALWLLLPVVVIFSLIHAKKRHAQSHYFAERFGLFYPSFLPKPLWLHAASVGEVQALVPLIRYQRLQETTLPILLSVVSPTGFARAQQVFAEDIGSGYLKLCYLPLDYPFAVRRFLRHFAPCQAVIAETELWLNLYRACADLNIRPIIINARLSKRTTDSRMLKPVWQSCVAELGLVLAKSAADLQAYQSLGAPKGSRVIGNLKLAQSFADIKPLDDFKALQRAYIVALSTHEDEEVQLLNALQQCPALQEYDWIFVPRHSERGAKLQAKLQHIAQQPIGRRSLGDAITPIYLADTTGEAARILKNAAACFVGGSLIAHGGQNILEPVRLGVPTVIGKSYENFAAEVGELAAHNAILIAQNAHEVMAALSQLLQNPAKRQAQINAGNAIFANADAIVHQYYQQLKPLRHA